MFSIIVDPSDPKVVYASACSGIYKSDDAGLLFHKVQGIPTSSRRTRVLAQDPRDLKVVFAGTTEGLFRTEDAGKQWTAKSGTDIIVNDVAIDREDSKRMLIATDRGGVLASEDGGDTFHPANGGFSTRQIATMKRDTMHSATLYVGVVNDKEWGGVFRSDNGGLNWKQESEGLGGRDVFSLGQAPDGSMIAGTAHGLFRLASDTEQWQQIDNAPAAEAPGEAVAAAHPALISTRPPVPIGRNHFAERGAHPEPSGVRRTLAGHAVRPSRARATPAARKAALLAAAKKRTATKGNSGAVTRAKVTRRPGPTTRPASHRVTVALPPGPVTHVAEVASAGTVATPAGRAPTGFDGSVYVLATSGRVLLAATSAGLLTSADDGVTWSAGGPRDSVDWRFMAAAKQNVVAASLNGVQFSSDSGASWVPIQTPEELTRVSAVAVEPSGYNLGRRARRRVCIL